MGVLTTIIGVLPYVGSIVQGIESLFGHGGGGDKKQAAMGAISAGLNVYSSITGNRAVVADAPTLESHIGQLIDAVVLVYNDLGIFTHGSAPAAAPAK